MEALNQQDFEMNMKRKPQLDFFEYLSNKEAQGDRLSYTLIIRGKPSVSKPNTDPRNNFINLVILVSYVPSSLIYGIRKMDFTGLKTSSEIS